MTRKKKCYVAAGTIISLLLLYTVGGFWGVPKLISWALTKYAEPLLLRQITASDISFNPYTLRLTSTDFCVDKMGADKPPLLIDALDVKLSWSSLYRLAPVISHLVIDGLHVHMTRTGLVEFDFDDTVASLQEEARRAAAAADPDEKKDEEPFRFALHNLTLKDSDITLDDRFRGRVDVIGDINIAVPLLSNFISELDHPSTPVVNFQINGRPVVLGAESTPFTLSKKTGIDFALKGIELENLASFNPFPLNVEIEEGTLSARLNLAFAEEDQVAHEVRHLRLQGNITLDNVAVDDVRARPTRLLGFRQLSVDIDSLAIFAQVARLGKISLVDPKIAVARAGETELNLTQLAEHIFKGEGGPDLSGETSEPADPMTGRPWDWSVAEFSLTGGTVSFADELVGFSQDLSDISVKLTGLSGRENSSAALEVSLGLLNGSATVSGSVGVNPPRIELDTDQNGISLPLLQPYVAAYSGAVLADGVLAHHGRLSLSQEGEAFNIAYQGGVDLTSLAVADGAGQRLIGVERLELSEISARQSDALTLGVGAVTVSRPEITVALEDDGEVNLARLTTPPAGATTASSAQPAASSGPAPRWRVESVRVSDGLVRFSDLGQGFSQDISDIQVSLSGLSDDFAADVGLEASLRTLGGALKASGAVAIEPLSVRLRVETSDLDLTRLAPYLDDYATAQLRSGAVSNSGQLSLTMVDGAPSIGYQGDASVKAVKVDDEKGHQVASFSSLRVEGVDLSVADSLKLGVKTIALDDPQVTLIRAKDGAMNVAGLVKESASETAAEAPAAQGKAAEEPAEKPAQPAKQPEEAALPPVRVDRISLRRGRVSFSDASVKPAFVTRLTGLALNVTGLSTTGGRPAKLTLSGKMDGSPLKFTGEIDPKNTKLNLKLNSEVEALSLHGLAPYSVLYTGHPIKQGLLSYHGEFNVVDDDLDSSNRMEIDRLEFGPTDPQAETNLPVGLAVALLQDRSGKIDLNIPVSGSLDDPQFSVGGIIVKVIVNLISKAVTAPFALIGSMFGASDQLDLNHIAFQAGSTELDQRGDQALSFVAKALTDRPGLKLQVVGLASESFDGDVLRQNALMQQVRETVARKSDPAQPLTEEQVTKGIEKLFRQVKDPNKPDKKAPLEEKREYLTSHIEVTPQQLSYLASERAGRIKDFLVTTRQIDAGRVFVANAGGAEADDGKAGAKLELQ